ncbi:MAG: sensor histidine kinase [Flavisolibacter sp.]
MPVDILYTYLVAYYIFPKYIPHKGYYSFFSAIAVLSVLSFLLYYPYEFWSYDLKLMPIKEQLRMSWFILMNYLISGPPILCATFLTIKMLKNFYEKMEEKQQLVKENANAELQLLKARVHPHFLFNTLNNIYSFSLTNSPKAKNLIRRLADTLRYMIYDCDQALVPLSKELKLLKDYIALEKIRYGTRLKIETEIEGDTDNKLIAPLLMIPFVENCFKHGTSQMIEECWVNLRIEVIGTKILFEISNSKPVMQTNGTPKGIGLKNVQKRLELIYPGQYHLQIVPKENSYQVYLQLQLSEVKDDSDVLREFSTVKNYQYA